MLHSAKGHVQFLSLLATLMGHVTGRQMLEQYPWGTHVRILGVVVWQSRPIWKHSFTVANLKCLHNTNTKSKIHQTIWPMGGYLKRICDYNGGKVERGQPPWVGMKRDRSGGESFRSIRWWGNGQTKDLNRHFTKKPFRWQIACVCVLHSFCCVWLFATPWTVARQAPLSMGFSRQDCWSGLPCPSLPNPGIEPVSPALQVDSLLLSHRGSRLINMIVEICSMSLVIRDGQIKITMRITTHF